MAGERSSYTFTIDSNPNDQDQNIDGLLWGYAWNVSSSSLITYSFPDSASDIAYLGSGGPRWANGFNADQQAAARKVFEQYGAVSGLTFEELGDDPGENDRNATIRLYDVTGISTARAYSPGSNEAAGDSQYRNGRFEDPKVGTYEFHTLLHEVGHNLGMDHGHEGGPALELRPDRDGMEFSVMTYESFVGQNQSPAAYTNSVGHYAQTIMMYDIAAIQYLYGANYTYNSGDTVYSFDPTSGATLVNGVVYETPSHNVIFRTIWDGNGTDTYDLSNYTTDLRIDLAPEGHSDFDVGGNAQRARLNAGFDSNGNFVGAPAYEWARGHVFNALQVKRDTRSLIENAKGGSGDDEILGNTANNVLSGGSGNDTLTGFQGLDTLQGGDGDDRLNGGASNDRLLGGDGNDILIGGGGIDILYGGADNDSVDGGAGNDYMHGLDGNDTLVDGAGEDKLEGGIGMDRFELVTDGRRDRIADFEDGQDLIVLHGAEFADLTITDQRNGTVKIAYDNEVLVLLEEGGAIDAIQIDAADFLFA